MTPTQELIERLRKGIRRDSFGEWEWWGAADDMSEAADRLAEQEAEIRTLRNLGVTQLDEIERLRKALMYIATGPFDGDNRNAWEVARDALEPKS